MPPIFIVPMPTIHPQQGPGPGSGPSGGGAQRSTFRPPWIKDGPEPLPMPAAPWTRSRNLSRDEGAPNQAAEPAPVRRQSKITIIPSQPQENGTSKAQLKQDVVTAAKNKQELPPVPKDKKMDIQVSSKQTPPKEAQNERPAAKEAPRERKMDIKVASKQTPKEESKAAAKEAPKERKVEIQKEAPRERKVEVQTPVKQAPKEESKPAPKPLQRTTSRDGPQERKSSIVIPTPPKPPAPPMPPPPPPPGLARKELTESQLDKLDALRSRPRKRPDWGSMMKEVEGGKKLKHVQCNDRSSPIIPEVKVSEQFMYESEKPNVHNQLLRQIQGGVPLKRVQTNDRSKPILDGLRKFRRQMTIEEQIQKSQSMEQVAEVEPDEMDDIDKVRDDLQSTKQMLALELRNKEAVERENKRLQARLLNLELELEKDKLAKKQTQPPTAQEKTSEEQKMVTQLKSELVETQKTAQDMETRYHNTVGELDMARAELEELRRKNKTLERRVSVENQPLTKQPLVKKINQAPLYNAAPVPAPAKQESEEESEYEEETETEEEEDSSEDEEKAAALREKREARELRLLATKVRSFKEKQDTAHKERRALRMQLKNQQHGLRDEKKKYKVLHKEVDKMAKLMKEDEDDEEEEEEEDEGEEQEETESEESSSEESDEDDSEGDLPAEAPAEERRKNLTTRAKRHENILAALKKGNYMLKANVDRLKDDLFKQKEMSLALQEDLNSVLTELG